jgi:histidinol-phosphate aminotransferase
MNQRTGGRVRKGVRELKEYVPGEQPAGGVCKLNTNENPYPPSPKVLEALRTFDPSRLRLYPDPACGTLRQAIAALHGCTPAHVVVGNGSDEILALCARVFPERDGTIGWFEPSYSLYPVLAAMEEIEARPVGLGPEFEWRMPDDYEASLFFLTTPNAPTGTAYGRNEVESFCRRSTGVVVLDEAYADFAPSNFMELALTLPNVIVARTLSKSYSLAGLRVGYAVGHPDLITALGKIKDSYNVGMLPQLLATEALRDQAYARAQIGRVTATRARVAGELRRRGFRVFDSETNFLWIKPPRTPAQAAFDALRERRVFVRFFHGPRTHDYLRVTVGTDEQMDQFLAGIPD